MGEDEQEPPLFTDEELRRWGLWEAGVARSRAWRTFLHRVEELGPESVRFGQDLLHPKASADEPPLYQTGIAIDGRLWQRWQVQCDEMDMSQLVEMFLRVELDRHFRSRLMRNGLPLRDALWPDDSRRRRWRAPQTLPVALGLPLWRQVEQQCAKDDISPRAYLEWLIEQDLTRKNA